MKINNLIDDLQIELTKGGKISKRAARKYIISLLVDSNNDLSNLMQLLEETKFSKKCSICNKIDFVNPCSYCTVNSKNKTVSVFNSYSDLLEIGTKTLDGMESNFVIGDGNKSKKQEVDNLQFKMLENFVDRQGANEIILMFDKNIKSEIISEYIRSYFSSTKLKVSSLAVGISLGSSVEFLDQQTMNVALKNREDN